MLLLILAIRCMCQVLCTVPDLGFSRRDGLGAEEPRVKTRRPHDVAGGPW
jgi:hypothetical protein